jgi:hypothetical protein
MARTANTAAATATVAAAATLPAPAAPYVGKYHAAPKAVATKTVAYTLTAVGVAVAAANGAGKSGKVTVMGLVAVAAAHATAKANGKPVTGAHIVAAMRALPAVASAYGATRAGQAGGYAAGALPCKAWCSGYVAGAARAQHGLLAPVTA